MQSTRHTRVVKKWLQESLCLQVSPQASSTNDIKKNNNNLIDHALMNN